MTKKRNRSIAAAVDTLGAAAELHAAAVTLAMRSLLDHGIVYLFITARRSNGDPVDWRVLDHTTIHPEAVHKPPYAGNLICLRLAPPL